MRAYGLAKAALAPQAGLVEACGIVREACPPRRRARSPSYVFLTQIATFL